VSTRKSTTRKKRNTSTKRKKTASHSIQLKKTTVLLYVLVFANTVLIFSSLEKLFRKAENVEIAPAENLTIEVQNGCGVVDLAKNMTSKLRLKNYNITAQGNADNFGYDHTMIIDFGCDKPRAVEALRKDLGIHRDYVYLLRESAETDVRIIIGKDYENLKIFNSNP